MEVLGSYKNGNYNVKIFKDGTKIRFNKLDNLIPEKPESIDLKICNRCDIGCPMCHENSVKDGAIGDILNMKFLETLLPYTEIAIGGGNPLEHPDLIPFLKKCKDLKLIPSMTVNQIHFMKEQQLIKFLVEEQLIYGLGISLVSANDKFLNAVSQYPNAVIHLINGVHQISEIEKLFNRDLKILILGYKEFRRGKDYYSPEVEQLKRDTFNFLPNMVGRFKVISFDNLALQQLDCKRLLTSEEWQKFYMGNDGHFTMYIDAVNKEFARSSTSTLRYKLTDDIKEMFDTVRAEVGMDKNQKENEEDSND